MLVVSCPEGRGGFRLAVPWLPRGHPVMILIVVLCLVEPPDG